MLRNFGWVGIGMSHQLLPADFLEGERVGVDLGWLVFVYDLNVSIGFPTYHPHGKFPTGVMESIVEDLNV